MAPSLTTFYAVHDTGANATAVVTPSFTPSAGELLTCKATTWDSAANFGTGPTGGGLTWTKRIEAAPGGFSAYAAIWTATVGGSPSSMTVSATPSTSCRHSMVVERWSGAQLAGAPATNTGNVFGNGTACSFTVTSTGTGSVISWCVSDANSRNPSTRAYLSSATEEDCYDGSVGSNGVWYYAYQAAAAAGGQTCGLSAPTGMIWSATALEIQDSGGSGVPDPLAVTAPPQPYTARRRAANF